MVACSIMCVQAHLCQRPHAFAAPKAWLTPNSSYCTRVLHCCVSSQVSRTLALSASQSYAKHTATFAVMCMYNDLHYAYNRVVHRQQRLQGCVTR